MPVFVTDFDGTITRHDFYKLVIDQILPEGTPDYWNEYVQGRLTHFDALNLTFAAAPAGEARLVELVNQMEPDPDLAESLRQLKAAGWRTVIVSAGSTWYIDQILEKAGATGLAEVHANPGSIEGNRLLMRRPTEDPFYSFDIGINKSAVVRAAQQGDSTVAFAGNGPPDLAPALLVPPDLRFGRADLADALTVRGEPFHAYKHWSEVARLLIARSN